MDTAKERISTLEDKSELIIQKTIKRRKKKDTTMEERLINTEDITRRSNIHFNTVSEGAETASEEMMSQIF